MFKKVLLEEEAFHRLERLFKGGKELWRTEAEATFHADLVWVQLANGCALLVIIIYPVINLLPPPNVTKSTTTRRHIAHFEHVPPIPQPLRLDRLDQCAIARCRL